MFSTSSYWCLLEMHR